MPKNKATIVRIYKPPSDKDVVRYRIIYHKLMTRIEKAVQEANEEIELIAQ